MEKLSREDLDRESETATAPVLVRSARSEGIRKEWSDYLLDPETYLNQLEDVETTVTSMFADVPYLFSSYEGDPLDEFEAIARLLKTVSRAMDYLQRVGFCWTDFNIIVQESSGILRITPVDEIIITWLLNTIAHGDWSVGTTTALLQYLGISIGIVHRPDGGVSQWHIAQMLALGLMSYSGSHISNFPNRLASAQRSMPSSDVIFFNHDAGITMERALLACLDDFLGAPVWAFSLVQDRGVWLRDQDGGVWLGGTRHRLLTSLRSLVDLWGPVHTVYTDNRCQAISRINIERGAIVATSASESPVPCHWHSWYDPAPSETPTFSESSMLLIGLPRETSPESSSIAASRSPVSDQVEIVTSNTSSGIDRGLLTKNTDCNTRSREGGKVLRDRGNPISLGSSDPAWYLDGVTISGGLSKIITGGAALILKRRDGVVRKALLRQNWDGPEPRVDTLDVRMVIEISACTGNSRRIPLLEVFKLPNVRSYIYTNNSLPRPFKHIFFEGVDLGFEAFKSAWQQDQVFKGAAIDIIRQVLHELDQTGPAQTNSKRLTAWFAGVEPDGFLFTNRFRWMDLMANSAQGVALLVLSSCCLEYTSTGALCGDLDAQDAGLQTTLKRRRMRSSSPKELRLPHPRFQADHPKSVNSSSDDRSRHTKLVEDLRANSPSILALSRRQALDLPKPTSGDPHHEQAPRTPMVTSRQSGWGNMPVHARIDTKDGHRILKIRSPYLPQDEVQHIQLKNFPVGLSGGQWGYEEDIRGQRNQLDLSDSADVWIT